MKFVCVAGDVPLPANNGGRVDVWRRLQALKAAGHELALVCWYDAARGGKMSAADEAKLRQVCAEIHMIPITRSPKELMGRMANLWRMPSHAASRWVTLPQSHLRTWIKQFQPDAVLLDGLYGSVVARWLAKQAKVPMLFRSHNIEHHYMRDQYARERRPLRRLGLLANRMGLERFERKTMRAATQVFDISLEDCAFWQKEGMKHVTWLPTCIDPDFLQHLQKPQTDSHIDLLYFGNLNTPNNIEAVRWFIEEVLPLLPQPDLKIALAGSRPSAEVLELVKRDPRVSLIENPEYMAEVVARAGTIINPMRAGSGVNLKSVEMLFSDAALVSTSVGVKGLPDDAKACFTVADDPITFARGVQAGVARGKSSDHRRQAVRAKFSLEAVTKALSAINTHPSGHHAR